MLLVQPLNRLTEPTETPIDMSSLPGPTLPQPSKSLASPDGMRLRLLTLFALYDALPHSIAHSPDGDDPIDLDSAIEPRAIQSCLQSMEEQGKLSVDEAQALSAVYGYPTDTVSQFDILLI